MILVHFAVKFGFAACVATLASGCATISSLVPEAPANSSGNIFNYRPTPAEPAGVRKEADVDCPIVQVPSEQSVFRAYTGSDRSAAGVRYQYSFGEMSRECLAAPNNRIEIRVGVSGYVLAGPSGASGTFNVPIKVSVRRESDQALVASKTYRVATSIAAGESQSTFAVVSDPMPVAYISRAADEEYSIYVGFEGGGGPEKAQKRPARRRR